MAVLNQAVKPTLELTVVIGHDLPDVEGREPEALFNERCGGPAVEHGHGVAAGPH